MASDLGLCLVSVRRLNPNEDTKSHEGRDK